METQNRRLEEFFGEEYVNFASYDCYRKIASVVDGLKPSARKLVYTMIHDNLVNPKKVEQIITRAAEITQYLHGSGSLGGVCVGLAQDFVGANNIPLFARDGNFGNRLNPDAAAGRYIRSNMEPVLKKLFNDADGRVLGNQIFEGEKIEPMFYVPVLPLLLVNGSEGLAVGFSQKILPRNPDDLKKYIRVKLTGKGRLPKLLPWYRGFNGVVEQMEDHNSFEFKGRMEILNTSTILVTEVPPGITYAQYIKHLDKLEDNGFIRDYDDECDTDEDTFRVVIKMKREMLAKYENDHYGLMRKLKLIKRIGETYTCINEENRVEVFDNVEQIIDRYIEVRFKYYEKRKGLLVGEISRARDIAGSKAKFIYNIIHGHLIVNGRPISQVENDIEKLGSMSKVDGNYDYLFRMGIRSLTKERMEELTAEVKKLREELDKMTVYALEDMWLDDLKEIK